MFKVGHVTIWSRDYSESVLNILICLMIFKLLPTMVFEISVFKV